MTSFTIRNTVRRGALGVALVLSPFASLALPAVAHADAGLAAAVNMTYNPVTGQLNAFGNWTWTNSACPASNPDKYVGVALFLNGANPSTATSSANVLDQQVHLVTGSPCTSPANVIPSGSWSDNSHNKTTNAVLSNMPSQVCVVAYDLKKNKNNSSIFGDKVDSSGKGYGNHSAVASGAIANGDNSYTINNPDAYLQGACVTPSQLPTLTVTKVVVNDNGGTKQVANFPLSVTNVPGTVTSGTQLVLTPGSYTVSEGDHTGYTQSFSGSCDANGNVTITSGQNATCTITNNDIAPSLTLVKQLAGDGNAQTTDWTLSATGPVTISGAGGVTSGLTFKAGTYILSESAGPANYTAGTWSCQGGGSLNGSSLTLGLSESATCTLVNTFHQPEPASADISVTKTVDTQQPTVNENVTYTITVTNNGQDNATNVVVNDTLPAGLTYMSDDGAGSYVGGVWTVGSLASGASQTLHITATVNGDVLGNISNTASASATEGDPSQDNNESSVSINPQDADLSIVKDVDSTSPVQGTNVVYTITVTNNGEDTAHNVTVSDTLPAGLAYVSSNPSVGSYNSGTGAWTIGDLSVGAATLTITATVTGSIGEPISNSATVGSDTFDPNTDNNTDVAPDVTPVAPPPAVLTIVKTVVGGDDRTFDFTITGEDNASVTTSGGTGSTEVELKAGSYDLAEMVPVDWTLNGGHPVCIYENEETGQPTVTNGEQINVDSGDAVTCTFTDTYTAPTGSLTVTKVAVGGDGEFEFSGTGNIGFFSIDTTEGHGEYQVTLPVGTYTVTEEGLPEGWSQTDSTCGEVQVTTDGAKCTITNTFTPQTGHIIVDKVTDPSEDQTSFHFDTNGGEYSPFDLADTDTPNDQTLAAGTSDDVYSVSEESANGWIQTSAVCTSSIKTDSVPLNVNPDEIHLHVGETVTCVFTNTKVQVDKSSDVSVTKSVDDSTTQTEDATVVNPGDTLVYTLTAHNNGPDSTDGAVVTDVLPAGVTYVSNDGGATYDSGTRTITWNVPSMLGGESGSTQYLHITVTVDSDTNGQEIENTAVVTDENDNNPDNDKSSVTVMVAPECSDGQDNDGDGLVDQADPGCHSDNNANNPQSYDPNDNDETDQVDACINLEGFQLFVPEGYHSNNDHICSPNESGADLAVSKSVSNSSPNKGDTVTYTITVTNGGPETADGVVITDTLPAGTSYVSDDASGAYDKNTGVWGVGSLDNGESATLHITVTVTADAGSTVDNIATAHVGEESPSDPNDENNDSHASLTVATPEVHHSGGGGGGGGCKAGEVYSPTLGKCVPRSGSVLGASTSTPQVLGVTCGLYMDQHLKRSLPNKNNPDQVKRLQAFLVKWGYGTLPQTGFFGPLTEAAVKAFQAKYNNEILKPWGISSPTGLAYLTTIRELNLIECPDLMIPVPTLIDWNKNPKAQ